MYYKTIDENILIAIGTSSAIGNNQTEISETEYNSIMSIIQSKPDDTDTIIYKLNAESMQYEPYDRLLEAGRITEEKYNKLIAKLGDI